MEPQGRRNVPALQAPERNKRLGLRKTTLESRVHVQTSWAECRDKKVSASSRKGRISLDIPFYTTSPVTLLYVRVNHFRMRLDTGKITRGEVSRRQRRSFYAYPTT